MPHNSDGIYYADNSTPINILDSMQQFAETVSSKLNIVQVVSGTTSTLVTNSSNSTYVSSGLTATITPKFASSKILVLATMPFSVGVDTDNWMGIAWSNADFTLLKNSTTISAFSSGINGIGYWFNTEVIFNDSLSASYTDAPGSTAPVTYSISGKVTNSLPAAVTKYLKMNWAQGVAAKSSIVLLEVAA